MPKLLLVANVSKEHIRKFHIPLIELLKESGWQVDVACRLDEPVPECDHAYDLPCDRNPFNGGITKSIKRLKEILRENTYDVVLCNTIVGSIIGRMAAALFRKQGLKVIYLNHGLHFFPGASASRWALGWTMEKAMASKTDVMITINATDCATAKKYLKIPVVETCHGMGVNLSRFRDAALSNSERMERRKALGIAPDDFVLTYVAEIIDNKNQQMLLDAFEIVRKTVPNAKLMLVGPEHDNGALRKLVESKGLQQDVLMLGWRNDVPTLLHLADVYVASSKSEGLGLNLIEAMACGLPVVATYNRGHLEIVNHETNGFLVDINDCKKMAAHVLQLWDDVELRTRITRQADQDIVKFGTEEAMKELVEVIVRSASSSTNLLDL